MPEVKPAPDIEEFIAKWKESGGAERANYQLFITELCDLLGLEHPQPSQEENQFNSYVFDRSIPRKGRDGKTTTVFADCYKRGHFMLETKQGSSAKIDNVNQLGLLGEDENRKIGHGKRGTKQWDVVLERAYNQASKYIQDLPAHEGRPPFLIVCDVGYVLELYSEFTCTGGNYVRFPDPQNHRIYLEDLRDEKIRERLKLVWANPHALDPSKHAAKVTREVAWHLSELAKTLDQQHPPHVIAAFLQRCLFTMFAEDVGLLPAGSFTNLLKKALANPAGFQPLVTNLWQDMAKGAAYSVPIGQAVAHFNGGLFDNPSALPLGKDQIAFLLGASKKDWADVEPAIFGTLLERALDPEERHKLGAHYTPRSYVERLVKPTVIDPLRQQFNDVKAAAISLEQAGKTAEAIDQLHAFHHELCRLRILDPACGSGNFLYVTLEHMKRLEGEVLELLKALGDTELTFEMEQFKVRPQQFLGLEINERAVAIAQLVLWIGYFQWHKKTTGRADTGDVPLLPKEKTILHQDAVLAYSKQSPRLDDDGNHVTIWDGKTTKPHPVTGKEVPDESARRTVFDYENPKRPDWPEADFIVGNPPFIGTARMRDALGDGYTEALRKAWKGAVPDSADFVMFWWEKAAQLLKAGKTRRFGFITTNSIHQTFNRRVLEQHLGDPKHPLSLAYAIPDHPWVDSADGAAVRIAMTVASLNDKLGLLGLVTEERKEDEGDFEVRLEEHEGKIWPNLKLGADLGSASSLEANEGLSNPGVKLHGAGFIVTPNEAIKLGLGRIEGLEKHIRHYRNGKDLADKPRGVMVIDLFGLTDSEVRRSYPEVYQHVLTTVKPERDQNKRETRKKYWWLFGETNKKLRLQLYGLDKFITTPETTKHRFFTFLDQSILPDNMLVNIALDDAYSIGILSSHTHCLWSLKQGGKLGPGPRYNKTRCFDTFPFPDLDDTDPLKQRIRELGEAVDAHRKRQQAAHPALTLTGMYNVLEKLRANQPLSDKEQRIHDDGLVSTLKQLHDELDATVLEAYGWGDLATDQPPLADRLAQGDAEAELLEQTLLTRLVDLNHERVAEEKRGIIRWLRPDYQNPDGAQPAQQAEQAEMLPDASPASSTKKLDWPGTLPEQIAAVRQGIVDLGEDPAALTRLFGKYSKKRAQTIEGIIQSLKTFGWL